MKKKKCNYWYCQLAPSIVKFDKSLLPKQHKEFRRIFDEVWDHLIAAETDLGVLNSKIEGTWPKDDEEDLPIGAHRVSEGYYTKVGEKLYWIYSIELNDED